MMPGRKESREEVQKVIDKNLERGDWDLDTGDPYLFFVPSNLSKEALEEVDKLGED